MPVGILDGDNVFYVALTLSIAVISNMIIEIVLDAWEGYKMESEKRIKRLDGRK